MDELRKKLTDKLHEEQRGVKWFHNNYIKSPVSPNYTTTYHQIAGYIKTMPDQLICAINKYLKD